MLGLNPPPWIFSLLSYNGGLKECCIDKTRFLILVLYTGGNMTWFRVHVRTLTRPQKIGRSFSDFWEKSGSQDLSAVFVIEYVEKWLLPEYQIGRSETVSGRPLLPGPPLARGLHVYISCTYIRNHFGVYISIVIMSDVVFVYCTSTAITSPIVLMCNMSNCLVYEFLWH